MHHTPNRPALGAARANLLRHGGYDTWNQYMHAQAAAAHAAIADHAHRVALEQHLAHLIHDIDAGRPLAAVSRRLEQLAQDVA